MSTGWSSALSLLGAFMVSFFFLKVVAFIIASGPAQLFICLSILESVLEVHFRRSERAAFLLLAAQRRFSS